MSNILPFDPDKARKIPVKKLKVPLYKVEGVEYSFFVDLAEQLNARLTKYGIDVLSTPGYDEMGVEMDNFELFGYQRSTDRMFFPGIFSDSLLHVGDMQEFLDVAEYDMHMAFSNADRLAAKEIEKEELD